MMKIQSLIDKKWEYHVAVHNTKLFFDTCISVCIGGPCNDLNAMRSRSKHSKDIYVFSNYIYVQDFVAHAHLEKNKIKSLCFIALV